jgi:magnesium transporter
MYLSQLLGAIVEDSWRERIGRLTDIVAPPPAALKAQQVTGHQHTVVAAPKLLALVITTPDGERLRIPPEQVHQIEGHTLVLRAPRDQITSIEEPPGAIHLGEDVLDKEIVDVERKRVVRVNDVTIDSEWRLAGVDSSGLGLLRRLLPVGLFEKFAGTLGAQLTAWENVEFIPSATQSPRRLSTYQQLADLHPADIAEIIHHLTPDEGSRILAALDDEIAADTMEEIEQERQLQLLLSLDSARAADILERMGPDEAADLVAKLPEDRAQELLQLMQPKESEDVQELLTYAEGTAGSIMTTDYLTIGERRTAGEALALVRSAVTDRDMRNAYVYCVADETAQEQELRGVVSIWDLLAAAPETPLRELMEEDVITVHPNDDQRSVAERMAKYNLLAVPVVDDEGCIQGIVTVDDALDVLLPHGRRRAQRMY